MDMLAVTEGCSRGEILRQAVKLYLHVHNPEVKLQMLYPDGIVETLVLL